MTAPVPPMAPDDEGAAELGVRERAYWRRNIRLVAVLLAVWFAVSYGAGILFAGPLNAVRIPGTGFPLGFWMAQQGAIYVFVVLIFVYAALMNRLDRRFAFDEGESPLRTPRTRPGAGGSGPAAGGSGPTAPGGRP